MTLSIVREQGSTGEVEIHYQTRPALYQSPSNQATAGQDYTPKDHSIIMMDGAAVALVTVTILPVKGVLFNRTVHEICKSKEKLGIELMFSICQVNFIYLLNTTWKCKKGCMDLDASFSATIFVFLSFILHLPLIHPLRLVIQIVTCFLPV